MSRLEKIQNLITKKPFKFEIWNSQVRKPSLKFELWIMTPQKRVKFNCYVIAIFLLIFRNSEFLIKIKFPSYVHQKFHLDLITLKISSYTNLEFKIQLKFQVTSLKKLLEYLRHVLRKQLWLTWISGFLFDRFANLKT